MGFHPTGLLANVAFALMTTGAFFLIAHVARERERVRSGRCPACGYDLRGTPGSASGGKTCPECGAASASGEDPGTPGTPGNPGPPESPGSWGSSV